MLIDIDPDVQEKFQMYNFCRTFNCSPAEYEAMPYKETVWLLEIDKTYKAAERDAQEKAN